MVSKNGQAIFTLLLIAVISLFTACAGGTTGDSASESSATSTSNEPKAYPRGFDERSLDFLECPINGMKFRLATENELKNLNQAIEDLSLGNLEGQPIRGYLHGIIIRMDGKVAYPVKDGAPLLTAADAIDLIKPAKSDPNMLNNMGRTR